MDGQEPGRDYYEYYRAREQMQRSTYVDGDFEPENKACHPRAHDLSAPSPTLSGVAYHQYAAPGDNAGQNRMPFVSSNSGSTTFVSYPLNMARDAAHPDLRRTIPQLDGVSGDSAAYDANYPFYHALPQPLPLAEVLYDVRPQSRNLLPPSNSAHFTSTELHPGPAANAAMRPVHTTPARYPAETRPNVHSAPHDGAFYTQHRYASPSVPGSSSHSSVNRPESLRASVRRREGPSMSGHLRSSRESHPRVHTSGPDIPHSAASTSTTPAQQDFRTPHDPPPPLAETFDESTESRPSSSTAVSETTADCASGTPTLAPLRTLGDMTEYFPHHTPQHEAMRLRLLEVINAPWRRMNEKEPDSQQLLQFTTKVEETGTEKYRCLIWSEGTECGKRIPRSDRMLEHLRRHVGVRPFTCDCNSEGCPGVFPSKSAMYQHQKNVEPVMCQRCGAQCLRQNLSRHWRSQRCQHPDA